MSKSQDEFHKLIRERYPDISSIADLEYEKHWGEVTESEYCSYSWFESLANALNSEMVRCIDAAKHVEMLKVISACFKSGDDDVKKCIDVAFVENLFWQVPKQKIDPYWSVLPQNLKNLYVGFHGRAPL